MDIPRKPASPRASMARSLSDDGNDPTAIVVAALVTVGGGIAAAVAAWMHPPGVYVDPASAPAVQRRIAACVAAKPEIERAARHQDLSGLDAGLLYRIRPVHEADPSQCGELIRQIEDDMDETLRLATVAAAAS